MGVVASKFQLDFRNARRNTRKSKNPKHQTMAHPITLKPLPATWITSAAFAPYGQVIFACPDAKTYDETDAQLQLANGIPRFYIMRLDAKGRRFHRITRHQLCSQCLGSLEGKEWWLAVAPPSITDTPELNQLRAFRIPGTCFVKLEPGTWHAGPYFEHEYVDFYNLELSNTNEIDHQTCDLQLTFGQEFELQPIETIETNASK
jgi:ureidoglycolate hydrolase